jgi:alpha-amylase
MYHRTLLLGKRFAAVLSFAVAVLALGSFLSHAAENAVPTRASEPAPNCFEGLGRVGPDPQLSLRSAVTDWYKDAVVYHIWVAAFRDSDGDGVGDLKGIIQSLDVLKELGVNTLWLSPFFKNSSTARNLHGYDVTDHYNADPRLGSNEDVRVLLREAHGRGMRVIFDFVPNHISSRHPWFVEAADPRSAKRNWFVWRDTRPEKGWNALGGRGGWHPSGGAYYYGVFGGGMPDLNHANPEVRLEMARIARYWLDLGFDGLRVDAVKYLYENLSGTGEKSDQEDRPETMAWFESFRRDVLDPYTGVGYPKFMVAENWTGNRQSLEAYMVREGRPAFHMTLNFPMLGAFTRLNANTARNLWEWDARLPAQAWLGSFVSNHDLAADRPGTLFAARPEMLRAQAAWLVLGPGTPLIYYGNEIAQPQGPERGDIKHRKPLDWAELAKQRQDRNSVWAWHQTLIRLRSEHASLRRGKAEFLATNAGPAVLAVWRSEGGDSTLTVFNGQDAAVKSVRVTLLPGAAAATNTWLLGSGAHPAAGATELEVGPLAPFETKVAGFAK